MTTPTHLAAYLSRIGLAEKPEPNPAGLAMLQQAHRRSIGFENLDIALGRGIRIDSGSVFDKLVTRGRGGYCFEQNRLFSDMLALLGFAHRPLLARVRLGGFADGVPPRTHVCLLVESDGVMRLADAGFGGSYVPPMSLEGGAEIATGDGARHRVRPAGPPGSLQGEWLLERAGSPAATDGRAALHEDWQPQYSFDLAEVAPLDLEQANHWTSTRPETRFTTLTVASIALADGFAALTDRSLTIHRAGRTERREIDEAEDYRETLAELFRIRLDAGEVGALPLFCQ